VPFKCVTKIKFDVPPVICETGPAKEIASFTDSIKGKDFADRRLSAAIPVKWVLYTLNASMKKYFVNLKK